MSQPTTPHPPFDIRTWIDADRSGRAACPSCLQDGKPKQHNLSINLTTGAYHCWRGCSTTQIRAALGATSRPNQTSPRQNQSPSSVSSRTIPQNRVRQSQQRLLDYADQPQTTVLTWLADRGLTREVLTHYQLGLEKYWFTPDPSQPNVRECYWAIALHIPANQEGQFYRKLRIAPWLTDNRPDALPKWSQSGVPATIFYTYCPDDVTATWFCEGEWDAMRLGWLARQQQAKIAVCCSTAGCGTVPKPDQLNELPGEIVIWFDRNDTPTKNGVIPGDEGARKLAQALGDRARIAQVPMPESCPINGWDVSNALDAGFTWTDFENAATIAAHPSDNIPEQPPLRDVLQDLLTQNELPFQKDLALMNLAHDQGYSYRDIDHLAKSLSAELDLATDQANAAQKLQDIIQTRRTRLDLTYYLEPWFAQILTQTARAMPTAPEFLFTTLLPAAASRIGSAAQVVIKPSAKYTQPMVFWTADVSGSGTLKTPAQRIILDPLIALEKEAHALYQVELENYERSKAAGTPIPKPIRQRYLTKDSTLETLQRIHAENPRGILYYRDELAGSIKVRNQYRGGYGADEEAELDQWNGSAVIVDRAEKSICLPNSAISRTGSIQWEVLANLMGDHQDTNGAWSRWLFCAADAPPRYLNLSGDEPESKITETLTWLYTELAKVPRQDYLLSFEAKHLFEAWQHQLVDAQRAEAALGLQLVYPKIEAYTARFALWLHIVNAVLRREQPTQMIGEVTMEQAIELAAYYLWQHKLIHMHNSPDSGLAAIALKIHKYVERVGEATASKLKSGIRALRKMGAEQIRQLMQTLANTGYGAIRGVGAEMTYIPVPGDQQLQLDLTNPATPEIIDTVDAGLTVASIDETASAQGIHIGIDGIDNNADDKSDEIASEKFDHEVDSEIDGKVEPKIGASDVTIPPNPCADAFTASPSFQRGMPVEVWFEEVWIPATYLRPWHCSVLSHRTGTLDEGHQVALSIDEQRLRSAWQIPSAYKVARADLRVPLQTAD
jgi:Protein of unknown function (DUF3987)